MNWFLWLKSPGIGFDARDKCTISSKNDAILVVSEMHIWMDFILQLFVLKELSKADKLLYCRVLVALQT